MAKLKSVKAYDGAENKMRRLGLQPLVEEAKESVKSTIILVEERKREGSTSFNGAAAIRELVDGSFRNAGPGSPNNRGMSIGQNAKSLTELVYV